jgi:hypothetical protein
MNDKKDMETCLALYLFNSNKISADVSPSYGEYAEGGILKAISRTLQPPGQWTTLASPIQIYRGDILDQSIDGGIPPVRLLTDWIRSGKAGLDASNLDSDVASKFKSGENLGYVLYALSIAILQKTNAIRTHQELKSSRSVGYIGLVTQGNTLAAFANATNGPSTRDVSTVTRALGLPQRFEINGSNCSGNLLASDKDISEAGLHKN